MIRTFQELGCLDKSSLFISEALRLFASVAVGRVGAGFP